MYESESKIQERVDRARNLADRYLNRVLRKHPASIPLSGIVELENGAKDTIAVDSISGLKHVESVWVAPEERLDLAFQLGVAVGRASLDRSAHGDSLSPATVFPAAERGPEK